MLNFICVLSAKSYVFFVCLLLRVENSQVDSLREIENMDVSLVATFIALNLHSMSR